jgi:hypothetical protein
MKKAWERKRALESRQNTHCYALYWDNCGAENFKEIPLKMTQFRLNAI